MATLWKGIYKAMEECGELVTELGKAAAFPVGEHPDGKGDIKTRIEDEIADVLASTRYVAEEAGLDSARIMERALIKYAKYKKWELSGVEVKP